MTVGLFKGVNVAGHKGWTTRKCRICNKILDLFYDYDTGDIYYCPKCGNFFCAADAKRLKYRCPYDGAEIQPYY